MTAWTQGNGTAGRDSLLVRRLIDQGIRDPRVLAAFARVPRSFFVPDEARDEAEADRPLEIGCGQTISQPYVVAAMAEALDLTGLERSVGFRLRTSAFCAWKTGLALSGSGVAANFQALPSPPRSLGTGLPDGFHGKSACATPPPAAIIASAQPDTARPLRNAPPGTLGGSLRVNARVRQWEPSRFEG